VSDIPGFLVGGDDWLIVLPLAFVAALLVARRAPGLAVLMLGTPLLTLVGLAAVYWISVIPIAHYIDTSAERTVLAPLLFAGVLLPVALARLLEPEPARATAPEAEADEPAAEATPVAHPL
jgi:hypothetical protein